MATIVKPNTFSSGATIIASDHNSNFDTIYSDYNGNITNANLAANAGIVDSKLAQITTASKVSGTALTSLASIIAGAGVIPTANLGSGATASNFLRGDQTYQTITTFPSVKLGSFSRDLTVASGNQSITGVGFIPKLILFLASINAAGGMSIGFDDGTSTHAESLVDLYASTPGAFQRTNGDSIFIDEGGGKQYGGFVNSFDADGFTIAWTKSSTPTGTVTVSYLALG